MTANTSRWEGQKAIVSTLTSSATFTSLVATVYDEPPTNADYPYVVIGGGTEVSDNNLQRLGFEATLTLFVYTRPYGLGWYPAYQIYDAMNEVLNVRKLTFENDVSNLFIKSDSIPSEEKEGDKRILHCRYRFWTQQDNLHTI